MTEQFIIMSAPNGARRQKTDHANLPISPDEMAQCAQEIVDVGASILHLHVRGDDRSHSLNVDRYQASISAIKARVGDKLIIQATSEAVGIYSRDEQIALVKTLKPEAVSLALRELCPTDNEVGDMADLALWMARENIFPQYILYDELDYQRFETYTKQGVFANDDPFTLFVLGKYQQGTNEMSAEAIRLREISKRAAFPWAVCGFGVGEIGAITHAAENGGHIRVGFENNLLRSDGTLLSSNAEMISLCSEAAGNVNRPVASADDVRTLFNFK